MSGATKKGATKVKKEMCLEAAKKRKGGGGDPSVAEPADDKEVLTKKEIDAFGYKMRTSSAFWKKYYEGGLKNQKAAKSQEKFEFMKQVLQNDFKGSYFERIERLVHTDAQKTVKTWMSWKQITDLDGVRLVRLGVKQNKIEVQLSEDLDHDDPDTAELDEEERMQYRKVDRIDEETTATVNQGSRSADDPEQVDIDMVDQEADEKEEAKKRACVIRKTHTLFSTQQIDIKSRLDKFKDTKYTQECWLLIQIN